MKEKPQMTRPLVSVIVTTKNESKNIGRFLTSIKKQTYKPLEIIVVDNNSTDGTVGVAKKFTSKIYNIGPERSAQRNYGALKAKGKYLIFLDADMEVSSEVLDECVEIAETSGTKILTVPETTKGNGFLPKIRKFEREMYMGEFDYEVPRFFEKSLFSKYDGYDESLTGPEDYDLPYRMSRKNKIGRSSHYIYHHEEGLTLIRHLKKKYYYAQKGALYAVKHPRLVKIQGTILFRKVYLKNWKKFVQQPILGISFIAVRFLETIWAVAGFISAAGLSGFFRAFRNLFKQ